MFGMFLAIDRIAYDRAVLFAELAAVSGQVGATRSRSAKVEALAECLRALADDAESEALAAGVCFLAGRLRQGRLGVGPAAVRRLRELPAAATSSLTVGDIDRALAEFERQRPRRVDRLQPLVRRASADERDYLLRLLIGEVRQGALDGLLVDAIATAAEAPLDRVRRALMVSGDLPAVAEAALRVGVDGLQAFQLQVFQPVEPMLAQSAPSVAEALGAHRCRRRGGRSWTACGCRSTATGMRCGSSRAACATSPPACRRRLRPRGGSPPGRWWSMGRRSRWAPGGGRVLSRRP